MRYLLVIIVCAITLKLNGQNIKAIDTTLMAVLSFKVDNNYKGCYQLEGVYIYENKNFVPLLVENRIICYGDSILEKFAKKNGYNCKNIDSIDIKLNQLFFNNEILQTALSIDTSFYSSNCIYSRKNKSNLYIAYLVTGTFIETYHNKYLIDKVKDKIEFYNKYVECKNQQSKIYIVHKIDRIKTANKEIAKEKIFIRKKLNKICIGTNY